MSDGPIRSLRLWGLVKLKPVSWTKITSATAMRVYCIVSFTWTTLAARRLQVQLIIYIWWNTDGTLAKTRSTHQHPISHSSSAPDKTVTIYKSRGTYLANGEWKSVTYLKIAPRRNVSMWFTWHKVSKTVHLLTLTTTSKFRPIQFLLIFLFIKWSYEVCGVLLWWAVKLGTFCFNDNTINMKTWLFGEMTWHYIVSVQLYFSFLSKQCSDTATI